MKRYFILITITIFTYVYSIINPLQEKKTVNKLKYISPKKLNIAIMGNTGNVVLFKDLSKNKLIAKKTGSVISSYKLLEVGTDYLKMSKNGIKYIVSNKLGPALETGKKLIAVKSKPSKYLKKETGVVVDKKNKYMKVPLQVLQNDIFKNVKDFLMQASASCIKDENTNSMIGCRLTQLEGIFKEIPIEEGDIVTGIGGRRLNSIGSAIRILQNFRKKFQKATSLQKSETIKVAVLRNGVKEEIKLEIGV